MNENNIELSHNEVGSATHLDREAILELNFVPAWARKPPGKNYFDYKPEEPGRQPYRRTGSTGQKDGRQFRNEKRTGETGYPKKRHEPRPARKESAAYVSTGHRINRPVAARSQRPPVNVRILPGNKYLAEVARLIHKGKRTYPLMEVASLFLANPGACEVRIEVDTDADDCFLFQCKCCKTVTLSEETLIRHMTKEHMDKFLVKEELVSDPPAGQFKCVAKCGLSGILLGPPNHHSYNVKLQETYKSAYSHMTFEEYSGHVVLLHDSESIEQWKESCRKQYFYRIVDDPSGTESMPLNKAEAYFREKIIPSQKHKTRRAVLPLTVSRDIGEPGLLSVVREAWLKENRFPSYLMLALRGAFSHKGLKLFKAGGTKGITFVSPIVPVPLKLEHVVDSIRNVLIFLKEHPGCSRNELVSGLKAGVDVTEAEKKEILSPLSWLVERGHIIEFFDGTLSVPLK